MGKWEVNSSSYKSTMELGRRIGQQLRGGEIIRLIGDVGTGKTTFVRGLVGGIGSRDHVSSPTFTVHKLYKGRLKLYHYDFYRVGDDAAVASELTELMREPDVSVALEWPQQANLSLPAETLDINFRVTSEHGRAIELTVPRQKSYLKKL